MQVHLIDEEIDRHCVIASDANNILVRGDLDFFALHGNIQILDDLEDTVADLFFRIVVHHSKSRLFLHLIGELIFGDVGRQDFVSHKGAVDEQDRPKNRLDRAGAALQA